MQDNEERISVWHKDEEIIHTNVLGGKQSDVPYRFDLMNADAMLRMARILKEGADKYGDKNWHNITTPEHLNHAIGHIYLYLNEDPNEDHLGHAFTRLMMAVTMDGS